MFTLTAKTREKAGRKVKNLRKEGILPAVLYGPELKATQSLEINLKEFDKVFKEAGESSLISLEIDKEKIPVLIHDFQKDSLTEKFTHVDFYQPKLKEEIEVKVPLIFEGEAPAVKELGGTFIKNVSEVRVRALPQNLPHEIRVNIGKIKTFEDFILIQDLSVSENVKILNHSDEIIASVTPLEKIEEELQKPIEEKVEDVGKLEAEKKEEEVTEEEQTAAKTKEG